MSTAGVKDRARSFPAGKGRLPKEGELRPLSGQREKIPLTVAFCGELRPDCVTRPGPDRPGRVKGHEVGRRGIRAGFSFERAWER